MQMTSHQHIDGNGLSPAQLTAVWLAFAALLVVAPLAFSSATAVALLSQMGAAMIFGMSYNMLLGQGGMLSFGHAVFSGLGGFMSVHAMNLAGAGGVWLPLPFVPFVGGLTGVCFAALIGVVITRKSGTTFAMITLGIGEMVFASALMFPAFFGGEGGVSTNRVYGDKFFGLNFGSQGQVYGLIAVWLFLSTATVYWFTRTPLGRIINAVRDNDERVAFLGYDPQRARYLTLILSGFFAGVAGALGVINFEIASAENLSAHRSGAVLLFTFIGGVSSFIGPMVGAVVGVLMTVLLSDFTPAWHMYLGLLFILVVVYAPGGLASIHHPVSQLLHKGLTPHRLPRFFLALCSLALAFVSVIAVLELLFQRVSPSTADLVLLGIKLDPADMQTWWLSVGALVIGVLSVKPSLRWVVMDHEVSTPAKTISEGGAV